MPGKVLAVALAVASLLLTATHADAGLFGKKKPKDASAPAGQTEFSREDFAISAPSRMTPVAADQYYVKVVVKPEFDGAALAKIDSDINSRWRRLTRTDVRGYGVLGTLVVSQNGAAVSTIGPQPLVIIGANTGAAPSATTPLSNRQVKPFESGWILLGANQTLSLTLTETAQNDTQWQALSKNFNDAKAVVELFTPVAIPAAAPAVVDTLLNKFLGSAAPGMRQSGQPLSFDPTGVGEFAYNVEFRDLTSADKPAFARATVTLYFRKSMGGSPIWTTGIPENAPTPKVDLSTPISTLRLVPVSNPTGGLFGTADWTNIQNAANAEPNTPASFAASCETFRGAARQQAGMTRLDGNLSLLEALKSTKFSRRPDLMRSACFTREDRVALASAGSPVPDGVAIVAGGPLILTTSDIELLGKYLRKTPATEPPGLADLLKDKVAGELYTDPQVGDLELGYSHLPASGALSDLRGVGIDRFCCVSTVMSTDPTTAIEGPDASKRQVTLLVPASVPQKYLFVQAEFGTTTESDRKLGLITLRPSSDAQSTKARDKICGNTDEPAPAYLACAGAAAPPAGP